MKKIVITLGLIATLGACGVAENTAAVPAVASAPSATETLVLPTTPPTAPLTLPPTTVDLDLDLNDNRLSAAEWQYARVALTNEGVDTWQTREVAEAFGAGSCDIVRTSLNAQEFIDALLFAAYGEGNDFYTPMEWATVSGAIMGYMCQADAARLFG